ncbi:hypothetical protein Tco_0237533 [Tanacetum coccineum]
MIKALPNMYEKPSTSNKVFLIRQLVNTKTKEGSSVADHVNEFNSILSRLMSVYIKFDDEVQSLLLLSSLPESWSGTLTAVSGSTRTTKLKFDYIRDLILGEDICRNTSGENYNSLLSAEDKGRGRKKQDRGHKQNKGISKSKKRASKDNEVQMAVRDYDDALVCIANDKTLDIAGVGNVVLKTSFGTSWIMKDVRHMSKNGMKIIASKGRIPDLQKAVVGFYKPCVLRKQNKADPATMLPLSMTTTGCKDGTFNEDSLYAAKAVTYSSNLTKPNQKDKVVLEDSSENLANKCIVVEHVLSFEDSGRLDEEDSEDRSSFNNGGSETP